MYGTVAHMRVKAGQENTLRKWMVKWDLERAPTINGPVSSYVYRMDTDSQDLILTVVFKDKASYVANAEDPEQNRWYQALRQHLEADPEWHDGEVIYNS